MKKKIVGIFIVTLLIATAVLPAVGSMNEVKNKIEQEMSSCGCCQSAPPAPHAWSGWGNNLENIATTGEINVDFSEAGFILESSQYYEIENGYDFGYVEFRGYKYTWTSWNVLSIHTGYEDWHIETAGINSEGYTKIEVRFRYVTDDQLYEFGWCVDDITIDGLSGTHYYSENFNSYSPHWAWGDWTITDECGICPNPIVLSVGVCDGFDNSHPPETTSPSPELLAWIAYNYNPSNQNVDHTSKDCD